MTELASWLLTYGVHSTLLIGGVWLIARILPARQHLLRDTLWKTALVGGLVTATVQTAAVHLPSLEYLNPPNLTQLAASTAAPTIAPPATASTRSSVEGPPVRQVPSPQASLRALPGSSVQETNGTLETAPVSDSFVLDPTNRLEVRSSLLLVLLSVWLFGASFGTIRLLRTRRSLFARIGRRVELQSGQLLALLLALCHRAGHQKRVKLSDCKRLAGPLALGTAEICVPSRALTDLPVDEQKAMLAHELGHIVRRDPAWLTAASWIESLFFFQPLNRIARQGLQREAEFLCDDFAVEQTGGGLTLARCLAKVATWTESVSHTHLVASAMAGKESPLIDRVERLVDESARTRSLFSWVRIPAVLLLLGVIAFAAPLVTAKEAKFWPPNRAELRSLETARAEDAVLYEARRLHREAERLDEMRVREFEEQVRMSERLEQGRHSREELYQNHRELEELRYELHRLQALERKLQSELQGHIMPSQMLQGQLEPSGVLPVAVEPSRFTPRTIAPVPIAPRAPLADERPWDEGKFTLRYENENGRLRVRLRDGEVVSVRVDGDTISDDRWTVERHVLEVHDDTGDVLFELDVDLNYQWEQYQDRFGLQRAVAPLAPRVPRAGSGLFSEPAPPTAPRLLTTPRARTLPAAVVGKTLWEDSVAPERGESSWSRDEGGNWIILDDLDDLGDLGEAGIWSEQLGFDVASIVRDLDLRALGLDLDDGIFVLGDGEDAISIGPDGLMILGDGESLILDGHGDGVVDFDRRSRW